MENATKKLLIFIMRRSRYYIKRGEIQKNKGQSLERVSAEEKSTGSCSEPRNSKTLKQLKYSNLKMILGGIYRDLAIVNVKTGEILAEDNEGDLIKYTKKNSIEAYKRIQDRLIEAKLEQMSEDEKKYEIWTIDSFYKGNTQELKKIMNNLDVYEKAFLFSIAPYIGYDDCYIKCSNNTEMSFDKMIEISGMSKGKLSDVLQELIKKDILYKGKNSSSYQYFVNPWLFCKGNRINKVIKTMFKNYKIQIYKGIKWKDLKG